MANNAEDYSEYEHGVVEHAPAAVRQNNADYGQYESGAVTDRNINPRSVMENLNEYFKRKRIERTNELLPNDPLRGVKRVATGAKELGAELTHPSGWGNILKGGIQSIPNVPLGLINTAISPITGTIEALTGKNLDIPRVEFGEQTPATKFGEEIGSNMPFAFPKQYSRIPGKFRDAALGDKLLRSKAKQIEKDITEHEKSLEDIVRQHQEQLKAKEQAHESAYQDTGTRNPNPHTAREIERTNRLKQEEINKLNKDLEEQKQLPELPEVNTENHEKNVANAEQAVNESKGHVAETEKTNENAKNALNEHEESIAQHLGEGESHKFHLGQGLKQEFERNKKEIQEEYDSHEKKFADKGIEINSNEQNAAHAIVDDLNNLYHEDSHNLIESKDIGPSIDTIRNKRFIGANDFVSLLKSVNGYLYDAIRNKIKTGINEQERIKWEKRADKLQETKDKMERILEKSVGKKDFAALKKTGKRWGSEVASLYEHPVYKNVMKNGRVGSNVIEDLIGTRRGTDIIKNIIKNDPKLLRHAIGQRFESAPTKFYKRSNGEVLKEYIDHNPELQNLLKQREEHVSNVNQAERNVSHAKSRHAEIEKYHSKAKQERKEAESRKKEIESEKQKRSKEEQSLKDEIEKHKTSIAENNRKLAPMKKHIELLQKESKKTKMTLEQKVKSEQKIKEAKKELENVKTEIEKSKSKLLRASAKVAKFAYKHKWKIAGAVGLYNVGKRSYPGYGD